MRSRASTTGTGGRAATRRPGTERSPRPAILETQSRTVELGKENLGCARDDEVIRIAHQVDFTLPLTGVGETLRQHLLQSIQGTVRQDGRDNPALRSSFRGGEQHVLL